MQHGEAVDRLEAASMVEIGWRMRIDILEGENDQLLAM
jgi:hypothetical protein